jgi:hypothetical protein
MSKLETCSHRSQDQVEYGPSCCQSKRSVGYYCLERGIHGLTEEVCNACDFYINKTVEEDTPLEINPFE